MVKPRGGYDGIMPLMDIVLIIVFVAVVIGGYWHAHTRHGV